MVGLDWERVEGNKVKLVKNKLILDQFYFTSFVQIHLWELGTI